MQGGEGMAPVTRLFDLAMRRWVDTSPDDTTCTTSTGSVNPGSASTCTSGCSPSTTTSPSSASTCITCSSKAIAQVTALPAIVTFDPPPPSPTLTDSVFSSISSPIIVSAISTATVSLSTATATATSTATSVSTSAVAAAAVSASVFISTTYVSTTTVAASVSASTCTTTSASGHKNNQKGNSSSYDDDDDDDDDDDNDNNKSNSHHSEPKAKGISPGTEHALISIGSIGAFITVCFLVWLVWRTLRKHRQRKEAAQGLPGPQARAAPPPASSPFSGFHGLAGRLAARLPFLQGHRRNTSWQNLDAPKAAPPVSRSRSMQQQPAPAATEMALKTVDAAPVVPQSQVFYDTGSLSLQQQQIQQQFGLRPVSALDSSVYVVPAASDAASGNTLAVPGYAASVAPKMAPTADESSDGTLRSRMPDSYYNQSQLARQPSDAYDPARREVNRISELSSLSSGFGDGEIVMPPLRQPDGRLVRESGTFTIPPPPPPPPPATSAAPAGHFSWMRSSRRLTGVSRLSRRESVYTEGAEDQPARFRSVTSWVHQQKGRIWQAQRQPQPPKADDGTDTTPGIAHPIPAEQRLTMMADDGQEPRRPETVPGLQMAGG